MPIIEDPRDPVNIRQLSDSMMDEGQAVGLRINEDHILILRAVSHSGLVPDLYQTVGLAAEPICAFVLNDRA